LERDLIPQLIKMKQGSNKKGVGRAGYPHYNHPAQGFLKIIFEFFFPENLCLDGGRTP
jgi:hypothetical protein